MLAIILNITKEEGQVQGVVPNLVEDGFLILQYAYDTVVFMDYDIESAKNMKLLLLCILTIV